MAAVRLAVGLTGALSADGIASRSILLGWSITLAATFPLFDGGVTAAKIKEAELRLEQLKVVGAQAAPVDGASYRCGRPC